jgi:hypothetical protein
MIDLINRLRIMSSDKGVISSDFVNSEIEYLSKTLEIMRDSGKISNDAYLESGSIQGGLTVISSLLEQGISDTEIKTLIDTLVERSKILDSKYPDLNNTIESYRGI